MRTWIIETVTWWIGAAVVVLLCSALFGCTPATASRTDAERDHLEVIQVQVDADSLSAAALSAQATALRQEATAADQDARAWYKDGRAGEAAGRRADARAKRAEADSLERQSVALAAIAAQGRTMIADGNQRIAAEEQHARDVADVQERRATLDHLVMLATWAGGILAFGSLLFGIIAACSPWGVLVNRGMLTGIGMAGIAIIVLAQTLGAAIPWLPWIGAAMALIATAWEVRSIAKQGHTHAVSAVAHADVATALSRTVDALEGEASHTVEDAKAKLAQVLAAHGLTQRFADLRSEWKTRSYVPHQMQESTPDGQTAPVVLTEFHEPLPVVAPPADITAVTT